MHSITQQPHSNGLEHYIFKVYAKHYIFKVYAKHYIFKVYAKHYIFKVYAKYHIFKVYAKHHIFKVYAKHYIFKVYAKHYIFKVYAKLFNHFQNFVMVGMMVYSQLTVTNVYNGKELRDNQSKQSVITTQLSELPPLYCHIESHKSAAVSMSKGGLNVQTPTHTSKIMSK